MPASEDTEDSWTAWWNARLAAMESILGESDDIVGHATIPFFVGADLGGATDIVYFRHYVPGIVAVTCDLIGDDDQKPNSLGNYELAICQRDDVSWGADVISRLAYYTLEAVVEPGETMDMDRVVPTGSTISAFLFADFGRFVVRDRPAGMLLCLGIAGRAGRLPAGAKIRRRSCLEECRRLSLHRLAPEVGPRTGVILDRFDPCPPS